MKIMKGKKLLSILFATVFCFMFVGCGMENGSSSSSSSGHVHKLEKFDGKKVTCVTSGLLEHYYCSGCATYFLDEAATQAVQWKDLTVGKIAHRNIQHKPSVSPTLTTDGQVEHWYCPDCQSYYLDEKGTIKVSQENTVLAAGTWSPDFTVEVPVGRDPIVLQLTDTQIIDGAQARPEQSSGDKSTYATEKIPQFCYNYVEETIESTNPDLIIITGDLVYGKYDDNGSAFQNLVAFIDGFEIPWAPVFGNHDNESAMGADWQCQQLENAEHCLFKQRTLTGNGNYTVGIQQGGKLQRVFVMMDSNGCGSASTASLSNRHTSRTVGFGGDQVAWYTKELTALKAYHPQAKISFAFHVQLKVFEDALRQYGYALSGNDQNIWLHSAQNFGHIGRPVKSAWDSDKTVFNSMKTLGADSIFVGHEHCNSASVIFEGVRLQYGQKSSEYDRLNFVGKDNKVTGHNGNLSYSKGTPLVGGTVIVLSQTDGAIKNAYIFYCENAGGKLDWNTILK